MKKLEDLTSVTDTSSLARLCLEEAERRLGYSRGRDFIHVFIQGRKEYRSSHPSPDLKDRRANEEYQAALNRYATGKVLVWIEDQEYQMRTHSDGYNETA